MAKRYARKYPSSVLMVLLVAFCLCLSPARLSADPAGAPRPDGNQPGNVITSPAPLAATQGEPDIHDIRPPVQVGTNPLVYYAVAGGLLAALMMAVLVWWWRRRSRNQKVATVETSVYEHAHEEALRLLADLEQDDNLSPVLYYFRLSALLRLYLKRRYGINAPEMTTEELLPVLAKQHLSTEVYGDIKTFFRFADEVKFAKRPCEGSCMKDDLSMVRRVIDTTMPEEPGNGGEE
ncbi:MAG: DUF4381 domain-containing protein [Thermodesulfobacteriota bacterium]|nr:DUF4381 domain-containing protein [Thermodesulfobacteriota bacterium]